MLQHHHFPLLPGSLLHLLQCLYLSLEGEREEECGKRGGGSGGRMRREEGKEEEEGK